MNQRSYSIATISSLLLTAVAVIATWLVQASTYRAQGISLTGMFAYELSKENVEWRSAYWACIYPVAALLVAGIYSQLISRPSPKLALGLGAIVTALCLTAFMFTHWLFALLFIFPVLFSWCLVANAQGT